MFHRHQNGGEVWWFLESTKVSLNTWTHVAVTWDHVRGAVFIYANGQEIANRSYTPGASFFQPTGKLYQIGNDGHTNDHQFHGSVMDLYVFGTAHTLDQINRLRGEFCVTTQSIGYCKPSPKALRASLHPRLYVQAFTQGFGAYKASTFTVHAPLLCTAAHTWCNRFR